MEDGLSGVFSDFSLCFCQLVSKFSCSSSLYRGQTPSTNQGQTAASGPQGAPGDSPPIHFPTPPGMMSPDNTGLNQSPPNMCPGGPPMMGSLVPGDGPPHPGIGLPGPPPSEGNFFNNFFNQHDDMKMDGVVQEGESELIIKNN